MLKIFLKIFLRGFTKNRAITLFGILGLSIGLLGTYLVTLWVQDELSYDFSHQNYEDIYRVVEIKKVLGEIEKSPYTPNSTFGGAN